MLSKVLFFHNIFMFSDHVRQVQRATASILCAISVHLPPYLGKCQDQLQTMSKPTPDDNQVYSYSVSISSLMVWSMSRLYNCNVTNQPSAHKLFRDCRLLPGLLRLSLYHDAQVFSHAISIWLLSKTLDHYDINLAYQILMLSDILVLLSVAIVT